MNQKLQIQIVTFNSKDVVEGCLKALEQSNTENYSILIIDNASQDGTIKILNNYAQLITKVHKCNSNTGFAAAHNLGIRASGTEYVLVLNPDVHIQLDFLQELIKALDSDPAAGSACGKILLLGPNNNTTNIIDSTGLIISKNRRAFDRGQGEVDRGQYNQIEEIFGCSGAAVLYRSAMLEDIKLGEDYFDESFFAYKEDVDLAWRAQLRGWKAVYVPSAVAYHGRGWQPGKRSRITRFVQIHSYQNRYLMLLKNEEWPNLLRHLPQIISYDIAAVLYALFRTPYLLKGWMNIFRLLKPTLEKRKQIMARKKTTLQEIRQWFS